MGRADGGGGVRIGADGLTRFVGDAAGEGGRLTGDVDALVTLCIITSLAQQSIETEVLLNRCS